MCSVYAASIYYAIAEERKNPAPSGRYIYALNVPSTNSVGQCPTYIPPYSTTSLPVWVWVPWVMR